jgi:hypothetical protein
MTTYNTMNPVPSSDARDRYDNSQVFDELMNGEAPNTPDRLGVLRQSWAGMEQDFLLALANMGYETAYLNYVDGSPLQVDRPTQLIARQDSFYAVKIPTDFPVNLTGTWATDSLLLTDVGDASLRTALAAAGSTTLVGGMPAGTIADFVAVAPAQIADLDARSLALDKGKLGTPKAIIANAPTATAKDVNIVSDSIGHGAFAGNIFNNSWVRVLQRMLNVELGSTAYGFTPLLSLGSGGTLSTEIHNVTFSGGAWSGVTVGGDQEAASFAGFVIRSPGVGGVTTIGLPFFQNRGAIHYIRQPGGGTFTVAVNGTVVSTVDTNGAMSQQTDYQNYADAGQGYMSVTITQTTAGLVDIVGPAYYGPTIEPTVNNWSQSGRRLRYWGQSAINSLMATSSTFIMALGHNDQWEADSTQAYFDEFKLRIDWLIAAAKANNVKVVVPDFCWTASASSRTRAQLKRLADETSGTYINLPKMIFSGDVAVSTSHLIDTLKMWTDGSHPNAFGHKWIAETIARNMVLGCTTKRDAISNFDWWMPVIIKSASGCTNASLTTSGLTSSYVRSGNAVLVKLNVRTALSNPFPVGNYALGDVFNAKSELSLAGGSTGVGYVRNDTGAIVSTYSIAGDGTILLKVLSAYLNAQTFNFSAPRAVGTL